MGECAHCVPSPSSLSELVEEILRLNISLSDACLALAKSAPIPRLQELFTDPANLEERNDCRYVGALLGE